MVHWKKTTMKIKIKISENIDIYCALILLVQFTPVFRDFDAIVRKSEKCIASVLHEFDFFLIQFYSKKMFMQYRCCWWCDHKDTLRIRVYCFLRAAIYNKAHTNYTKYISIHIGLYSINNIIKEYTYCKNTN